MKLSFIGGVGLSQGLICTKRGHLGLNKAAFIEGCLHVRGGFYRGASSRELGVSFMRGSTVLLISMRLEG